MLCEVCGLDAGKPQHLVRMSTADGLQWVRDVEPHGISCDECVHMLAFRNAGADAGERAMNAWRWRRHRAERRGEPFTEPPPPFRSEAKPIGELLRKAGGM